MTDKERAKAIKRMNESEEIFRVWSGKHGIAVSVLNAEAEKTEKALAGLIKSLLTLEIISTRHVMSIVTEICDEHIKKLRG